MDATFPIFVGTSGYAYPAWNGTFFPAGTKPGQRLRYYGSRLTAVELNSSFYRMPSPELLAKATAEVGAGFRFAVKAPRSLTHRRRLKGCEEPLERLVTAWRALGTAGGPLLFQLPPSFHYDPARLSAVLAQLPPDVMASFEFRHRSWFNSCTFGLLRRRGVALCYSDRQPGSPPTWEVTAEFAYLRLNGERRADGALESLAARLQGAPVGAAYVFFKHEVEAPETALRLRALLAQ